MRAHTRRAVAFIAGKLISEERTHAVRDQSSGRLYQFNGFLNGQRVDVRDSEMGCCITGTGVARRYQLMHGHNNQAIRLEIDGERFTGYDYDSLNGFSGRVSGRAITLFDNEHQRYFDFLI